VRPSAYATEPMAKQSGTSPGPNGINAARYVRKCDQPSPQVLSGTGPWSRMADGGS
jgi:hypothetical protein